MKYFLAKKKAFTLVELLVTMSIISIMAAMSISAYPKFSEQISLTSETYKMLAYFRETQVYGVSAYVTPGTKILYSFKLEKSNNTISRYIIENPTSRDNNYYINSSTQDATTNVLSIRDNYEIYEILGIGVNSTTSLDSVHTFFRRPNPESRIVGKVGENIFPGLDEESFNKVEVTLRSKKNNVFMKKIVILQTGQMYVSDW